MRNRDLTAAVRFAALVGLCCGAAASLRAQERGPKVSFEHDGIGVTGFALYAEPPKGKVIRIDLGSVPADEKPVRIARLPLLPEDTYTLSIAAYNPAGESPGVPTSPSAPPLI